MSRYLRTKDGKIINLMRYGKGEERNGVIEYLNRINKGYLKISKDNFYKEADTIEELCDEFVCENSLIDSSLRKENGQIIDKYQKIDNAIMLAKKGLVVYGAIWTDKGLVYRAKMNEKGELELL